MLETIEKQFDGFDEDGSPDITYAIHNPVSSRTVNIERPIVCSGEQLYRYIKQRYQIKNVMDVVDFYIDLKDISSYKNFFADTKNALTELLEYLRAEERCAQYERFWDEILYVQKSDADSTE